MDVGALELVGELSPIRHMVTAGKALSVHSLTDQAYRRTTVLVSTPVRDWAWLGESIQYAVVKDSDIWGWRPYGRSRRATHIATPERAILDSIAQPVWGVSLSVAARALRAALAREGFSARLARAAARYRNAATARRVGYLVEHLAGPDAASPFLSLRGTSHSVTPLRTGVSNSGGAVDAKWMVRVNADLRLLFESNT